MLPFVVPPLVCGGLLDAALEAAATFCLSLREAGLGIAGGYLQGHLVQMVLKCHKSSYCPECLVTVHPVQKHK